MFLTKFHACITNWKIIKIICLANIEILKIFEDIWRIFELYGKWDRVTIFSNLI